jgi:hypothetical protein
MAATRSRIEKNDPAAMNSAKMHPPEMARQARTTARRAESHDAEVARGRREQDAGQDEGHHTDRAKRDAPRGKAGTADGLDAESARAPSARASPPATMCSGRSIDYSG